MARSSALALALLVAACAPAVTPAPAIVAPVPKQYTCTQEGKAAAELKALQPAAELRVFLGDYDQERKELRAVHGLAAPTPCPPAQAS